MKRIDSLESFEVGGATHWVLLRGNPEARRVLLLVQQGPGLPMIHEAGAIERGLHLESDAVVAYWDQRGTGRSWNADPSTIDLKRGVSDVRGMVDALCERLQVDRLDIVGFSLGGTLATLAVAENPARIGRLVVVGVDVDFDESENYAYAFACEQAARRSDRRAQRQLQAIGAPPHDTGKKFSTRVKWVVEYGGVYRGLSYSGLLWANVRRLLASPHYSIFQALQSLRAIERTQGLMLPYLKHFDLRTIVSRVDVPIAFFQGRHDVGTPPKLVAAYADALDAPRGKSFVWFEASAHMPHYEEPARFREALVHALEAAPRATAA